MYNYIIVTHYQKLE